MPLHFEGNVLVVFDDSTGKEEKYYGNKRVYEIPANGILRTKFKSPGSGRVSLLFFYSDTSTNHMLPYLTAPDLANLEIKNTAPFCYKFEPGTRFRQSINKSVRFERFIIARKSNLDSIAQKQDKFLEQAIY